MIKHIVLWTLKEQAGGRTKAENLAEMEARLKALPGLVPGVAGLDVSTAFLAADVPADIVLCSAFKSQEDLAAYQIHPRHLDVVAFIKSVAASRTVIDYEY